MLHRCLITCCLLADWFIVVVYALQAKFTQINEFLKLLIHTNQLDMLSSEATQQQQEHELDDPAASSSSNGSSSSGPAPIHILDCGCGSAHLTFGTYHYLHHVKGLPVVLSGVDTNAKLMERSNHYCHELGLRRDEAQFYTSTIRSFTPVRRPDIVLALHACDTATDEALALGVRSGAPLIMCVPCCHKSLHQQLAQAQRQEGGKGVTAGGTSSGRGSAAADLLSPMLDHGIMRQRFVDLLTDTFRAQLLRIAGYRWVHG